MQELEQAAAGVADAAYASVFCAEHIGLGVADEAGFLLVYSIRLAGLVDKARGGFPAAAFLAVLRESGLGVMGAVVERIEVRANFGELAIHPAVEIPHGMFRIVAAGDAGLVRDEDGEEALVVDVFYGFSGVWRPKKVLRSVKVVDIDVQCTVTIEKDGALLLCALRLAAAPFLRPKRGAVLRFIFHR